MWTVRELESGADLGGFMTLDAMFMRRTFQDRRAVAPVSDCAAVRHDLHRALTGQAAGERGRLQGRLHRL